MSWYVRPATVLHVVLSKDPHVHSPRHGPGEGPGAEGNRAWSLAVSPFRVACRGRPRVLPLFLVLIHVYTDSDMH